MEPYEETTRCPDRLKGTTRIRGPRGPPRIGRGQRCRFCARRREPVFATDIDEKGLASLKNDGFSEVARLDVRDSAAVAAMAKRVGKVDILLNAAGFVHHGTVLECSYEDWIFRSTSMSSRCTGRSARFLPGSWKVAGARS